eukprot:COSAG01_NODE_5260_length_4377_cov_13.545115_6_plen_225_part_00
MRSCCGCGRSCRRRRRPAMMMTHRLPRYQRRRSRRRRALAAAGCCGSACVSARTCCRPPPMPTCVYGSRIASDLRPPPPLSLCVQGVRVGRHCAQFRGHHNIDTLMTGCVCAVLLLSGDGVPPVFVLTDVLLLLRARCWRRSARMCRSCVARRRRGRCRRSRRPWQRCTVPAATHWPPPRGTPMMLTARRRRRRRKRCGMQWPVRQSPMRQHSTMCRRGVHVRR